MPQGAGPEPTLPEHSDGGPGGGGSAPAKCKLLISGMSSSTTADDLRAYFGASRLAEAAVVPGPSSGISLTCPHLYRIGF